MTTQLDQQLVDTVCRLFGDGYREVLTPDTTMDDIEGWDSLTFVELVMQLEDVYGVQLTDDEAAQMFQLGHAQRILTQAIADRPHDDVAYASCMLQQLRERPAADVNVLVLSGSSTREALLPPRDARERLRAHHGSGEVGWFNLSVSGLVVAETLQLLEQLDEPFPGVVLIGMSPVILAGCGTAEFHRSADRRRFPFAAPRMQEVLAAEGYRPGPEANTPVPLPVWVERYLKGRSLDDLQYDPYKYPTLAPWDEDRYDDRESILRFYNASLLNHSESRRINERLLDEVVAWRDRVGVPVGFVELTLHSRMRAFLDELGGVQSAYTDWVADYTARHRIPWFDVPSTVGLADEDFRDPAHIHRRRDAFTEQLVMDALTLRR